MEFFELCRQNAPLSGQSACGLVGRALSNMHEGLDSTPAPYGPDVVVHTWEVEAGESRVHNYTWIQSETEASLGYMKCPRINK